MLCQITRYFADVHLCRNIELCYVSLCSVVKEEIIDDDAKLPCFNGRVVSWVSDGYSVNVTYRFLSFIVNLEVGPGGSVVL